MYKKSFVVAEEQKGLEDHQQNPLYPIECDKKRTDFLQVLLGYLLYR